MSKAMHTPTPAQRPAPLATGSLESRPIAHLLIYALDRRLNGTFELVDGARGRMQVVVAGGLVSRVWTSEPVIYLGHVLYEGGAITGAELSASLAEVAKTKRLHGQVLLSMGVVKPEPLAAALRQQRVRKLHHAFSLSGSATFAFYPEVDLVGVRPNDVEPMDPLASVWRGLRAYPNVEHLRAALGTVGGRRLRLIKALDQVIVDDAERVAAESLRESPATVAEFTTRSGLSVPAGELLAYFLVITKLAELVDPVPVADAAPVSSPSPPLGAALRSGEYVRKISFAMRAVGGDAQPLRIPSPVPGRLAAPNPPRVDSLPPPSQASPSSQRPQPSRPAPPSRTPPAVRARLRDEDVEAEHALSQAEMHFVLGEREHAVVQARRALSLAPEMPEAMVFLAYLESLALGPKQHEFLKDLLTMADSALRKDDMCRRGRLYRAEVRKRMGDHDGAIEDLRMAVTNDPDDKDAQRELKAYETKVRDGTITLRSGPPSGGASKTSGLLDRLRGK